ncbi:Uncharacterised protein [Mycobacteroides abscessus subsp. abscessus]|uniref:hypothetical protein n=1 Tax=Mycobacteroides abscessus TaxID=36809 RepID=UPI0009A6B068|nr:hypothetical protein [Mycobacteroides abscessus]SKQ48068.1 Uncharacterised protein [Mycobacteroides abscessus subsp. massiliense]SLF34004.1 Uncharacterised protein [Mycobacteroides abscessus subsp. abscessus]SLF35349.1 Uncharacterised protein [Mycobacteroides abscessus subsp. abscessus]SLF35653.1 Uncharacterised protein [Mycobacteroides abscessus subsp. abscessus]SLH08475.1 Uncharacterised protein [Mycobacteroides abscessus subsp. abscessus]
MRRAYVEASVPFEAAFATALDWAGKDAAIRVGDTATVNENRWLEELGLPITSGSGRTRFRGSPQGTQIAVFLNLGEVLDLERSTRVEGIVVVPASGKHEWLPMVCGHAPWTTAFDAECLGGNEIASISPASAPIKAAIDGLTGLAVLNQGLIDSRERSEVVQTLTHFRLHGIELDPDALMVEALRSRWGGRGAEDLREIAIELNKGKNLRFEKRISAQALQKWATAQ